MFKGLRSETPPRRSSGLPGSSQVRLRSAGFEEGSRSHVQTEEWELAVFPLQLPISQNRTLLSRGTHCLKAFCEQARVMVQTTPGVKQALIFCVPSNSFIVLSIDLIIDCEGKTTGYEQYHGYLETSGGATGECFLKSVCSP